MVLTACGASESVTEVSNDKDQTIDSPSQITEVIQPKIEVTIIDFQLGMSTTDVSNIITKVGLKADSYGSRLYNQCSTSTADSTVVPMIEGGMTDVKPHLFDQACQMHEYKLIGSTSEVNAIFHDNQMVWAHFYSAGGNLIGSNQALIEALVNKYGQPQKYQYRDLFGMSDGWKWEIADNRILMKSSSLTLESIKGREEFMRRNKALNAEKGAVL